MPGMNVMPRDAAASAASAQPEVVSWSVSAAVRRPCRCAAAMTCAGDSVPSEWTECRCRSLGPSKRRVSGIHPSVARGRRGRRLRDLRQAAALTDLPDCST